MFETTETPNIFAVPIGADFSQNFVDGLFARALKISPEQLARTTIYLNTRRAARRIEDLFKLQNATLLPKIKVVGDLATDLLVPVDIELPTSPLERKLMLAKLVLALLDGQPDLAPKSSVFALADSLAALLDEMHGEGVPFAKLHDVELGDASEHWRRSLQFLEILTQYLGLQNSVDKEARQRAVVQALAKYWQTHPPTDPIIIAGSTGSRGATSLLKQAIAKLPNGAVVLPGLDRELPNSIWSELIKDTATDDHPQSMLARFLNEFEIRPETVPNWHGSSVFSNARNQLLSLALRPAPVTDQWLIEGPKLAPSLETATKNVSLIEAQSPKEEANAIAVCLREAAQNDISAVLISPDRNLTRRVAANLKRWNIIPDDSAGEPLHLSPAGIFTRLTANLIGQDLTPVKLIAILKHPLTQASTDRANHLRFTRDLEIAKIDRDTPIIRGGPPVVDFSLIKVWIEDTHPDRADWLRWLTDTFEKFTSDTTRTMAEWAQLHRLILEELSSGPTLWDGKDGQEIHKIFEDLSAVPSTELWSAGDYGNLLHSLLQQGEVRDAITPHPKISIWGTLEARVQGADLVILGGLNEGIWPQKPNPDPWLNRSMRKQIQLLLPERNIGLSAHDFQQAAAQSNVVLSRAIRDGEAPTVASRWIIRLQNLMSGIDGGKEALSEMASRGSRWLTYARCMDRPHGKLNKAKRPAPVPPLTAHPKRLSVTRIKTLIRNPYEIYAQSVLNLRCLKPFGTDPDALARGIIFHSVVEAFNQAGHQDINNYTPEKFIQLAQELLEENVPWPAARRLWYGRLQRIAAWFAQSEIDRKQIATLIAQEVTGHRKSADLDFTLVGKADRIDQDLSGGLHIYDYKTGAVPSVPQTKKFDQQLQLEAAIAHAGGFKNIEPHSITALQYISLADAKKITKIAVNDDLPQETWDRLVELLKSHFQDGVGYGARVRMEQDRYGSDYDHLSRLGEWEETDDITSRAVP